MNLQGQTPQRTVRRGVGRRLVLVGPYPAPWGGIAVHLRALHQLARREGIAVEVLDVGEGHALRSGAGGIRDAGSYGRFASELVRAAGGNAALHVHVPGNNLKAWVVAFAASRARPGGLLTVHSGLAPALLDGSPTVRRIAWLACAGYGRIFCANGEIAAALERAGVSPDRLEVLPAFVPGAVEPGLAPAAAVAARGRFGKLIAAALAPGRQYGEDVLLDGLALLCGRHPDLGCVVYGPGTGGATFGERVARRGLFGRVVALGEIDHPQSLGVMRLADVFVRPTRADGDSISVREALSLGVRVVASDVGHRPPEAALFRSEQPAELASRVELSLQAPPPAKGAGGDDVVRRIVESWRALGLAKEGART